MLLADAGSADGSFDVAQDTERLLNRTQISIRGLIGADKGTVDEPADQLRAGYALLVGESVQAAGLPLIEVDVGPALLSIDIPGHRLLQKSRRSASNADSVVVIAAFYPSKSIPA